VISPLRIAAACWLGLLSAPLEGPEAEGVEPVEAHEPGEAHEPVEAHEPGGGHESGEPDREGDPDDGEDRGPGEPVDPEAPESDGGPEMSGAVELGAAAAPGASADFDEPAEADQPVVDLADDALSTIDRPSLRELVEEHPGSEPDRREEIVLEIVDLPESELATAIELLTYRETPTDGVLDERLERAIFAFLAELPEESVLRAFEREAAQADLAGAVRLLEIVAGAGRAGSLETVTALVAALPPEEAQHGIVREALADAIASIVGRDESAGARVESTLREIDEALLPPITDALARVGGRRSLALLESMLGITPALDRDVVRALSRWRGWSESGPDCVDALVRILDSGEGPRAEAAAALGRLGAPRGARRLVAHVADEDPAVRRSIEWALGELTGVKASGTAYWENWSDIEEAWSAERAPEVLADLHEASGTTATRLLQELASHPWYADELETAVVRTLSHREPIVAELACETLRRFATPSAFASLVDALTDPRDRHRHAAWRALRELSGEPLPDDAADWLALLDD